MEEKKQRFLSLFREHIKRDGAEELLGWVTSSDFLTAPASTRYHGSFEGGLVEHSLNVFDCLLEELEVTKLSKVYSMETIAIVSLFHDICKANYYKKGTRNVKENGQWVVKEVYEVDERFPCGHGEKSVIILQNFIKLSADEIYAVRAHMGGFDASVKGGDYFVGKIFENSRLSLLLHVADMKATYLLEKR
ncbi:MAG: hydrolase [Ruthenibacterium sp.]